MPFRVLTRADCPVSPTNVTNTGGQIALWRLTDPLQVTLRHKHQANSERTVGASTKLQLSWNKLVTTQHCLEWLMLVYTRITHSRQCCNYLQNGTWTFCIICIFSSSSLFTSASTLNQVACCWHVNEYVGNRKCYDFRQLCYFYTRWNG